MSKCAVCNEPVMSTDKGVTVEDWCVWHTYHDEERGRVMSEQIDAILTDEIRKCELCGSDSWRVLHEGDESNCECEGECLRVCDNPEIEDGCDGVAYLVGKGE